MSFAQSEQISLHANESHDFDDRANVIESSESEYVDPKGCLYLKIQVGSTLAELMRGRTAYGERMKHLSAKDKPPRGKCLAYFDNNSPIRRSLASTIKTQKQQRLLREKLKLLVNTPIVR